MNTVLVLLLSLYAMIDICSSEAVSSPEFIYKSESYNTQIVIEAPKDYKDDLFPRGKTYDKYNQRDDDLIGNIRNYYHTYRPMKLNLPNGQKLNCMLPSKMNKQIVSQNHTLKELTDEYAYMLMREIRNICINSSIKEWFYKICPFNSAYQQLSVMKKRKDGSEYVEHWKLGSRIETGNDTSYENHGFQDIIEDDYYTEEVIKPGNLLNVKLQYMNYKPGKKNNSLFYIDTKQHFRDLYYEPHKEDFPYDYDLALPLIQVERRFLKVYNNETLIHLLGKRDFDYELSVEFTVEEIRKISNNNTFLLSKDHINIDNYIKSFPDAKTIKISRKVVFVLNRGFFLLDNPFPIDFSTTDFEIQPRAISKKIARHKGVLLIKGNFVYCFRCNFLLFYSEGDSLFIVIYFNLETFQAYSK